MGEVIQLQLKPGSPILRMGAALYTGMSFQRFNEKAMEPLLVALAPRQLWPQTLHVYEQIKVNLNGPPTKTS